MTEEQEKIEQLEARCRDMQRAITNMAYEITKLSKANYDLRRLLQDLRKKNVDEVLK